ncbi:reverse transcriptase N-terminal domain-containing protein [Streptomyces sp. MNU76]|uniref:reverse transcriptase N-terminal domain-containing protein n=1 Tax=Streptomyces sp. MNU76 TaxID=2560026 RepID=UPI001E408F79|nr:reverse transcriptase N-terminal domain-containing protein [Streptomyces sp. MNU76]MCC9705109.1 reverse transcriptase N-terminal domain-containing protein [Streptomyces sp. MNU76]
MKQVRNRQQLMLRSKANTLTGVRRVCQVGTGKKTGGMGWGEGSDSGDAGVGDGTAGMC